MFLCCCVFLLLPDRAHPYEILFSRTCPHLRASESMKNPFQVSLAGNPYLIRLAAQVFMWLKFIIRDRGGFSGGLLLFLSVCCRDRTKRILAVHTIKILR